MDGKIQAHPRSKRINVVVVIVVVIWLRQTFGLLGSPQNIRIPMMRG
jgi:hypothetical protein